MFQKAESGKEEVTIRRMEYRAAYSPAQTSRLTSSLPATHLLSPESFAAQTQVKQPEQPQTDIQDRLMEFEQQSAEREHLFALQLEAARKESFELGRREAESAHAAVVQGIYSALDQSLRAFRDARDAYLAQVEQEVVRLALSIAARILHREAMMDPLLLSGAVRVALGQLSDTTEVRLRVPVAEYELWGEMIRLMPNLPLRPQLVANDGLSAGECTLETHLGSVDLGVKAQLAEIERGFFDLLDRNEPGRRRE